MRYFLIIGLCLSVFTTKLSAQDNGSIILSKSFFATGEEMGLSLINISEKDEIVYLELLSSNGEVVKRLRIKSSSEVVTTSISLPLTLPSGWYILRAYTLWLPSMTIKKLVYQTCPIYNDLQPLSLDNTEVVDWEETNKSGAQFTLSADGTEYSSGSDIGLTIESESGENGISGALSVMDSATYVLHNWFLENTPMLPEPQSFSTAEGDEMGTELVYIGQANEALSNLLGALYIRDERRFAWLSLQNDAYFGFAMEDFNGSRDVQLLTMSPLGFVRRIPFQQSVVSENMILPTIAFPPLPANQSITNYLEKSRNRKIIADLFGLQKNSELEEDEIEFPKGDRSYVPEDFVRFSDTRDFIDEVVTLFKIRKEGEHLEGRLLLERNRLSQQNPLIFIDGYLVDSVSAILDIELDELVKIDLFRKEKTIEPVFGPLGKHGVVVVYTNRTERDLQGFDVTKLYGLQDARSSIEIEKNDDLPILTDMLYWNGQVSSSVNTTSRLSIPVSDDDGSYMILFTPFDRSKNGITRKIYLTGKVQ